MLRRCNGVNREAATANERDSAHSTPIKDTQDGEAAPIGWYLAAQAMEQENCQRCQRVYKESGASSPEPHSTASSIPPSSRYAYMYSVLLSSHGSLLYKVDGVYPSSFLLLRARAPCPQS